MLFLENSNGLRIYSKPRFGPAILVAITKFSRFDDFFNQVPINFSVKPSVVCFAAIGYISAVSMKFTPCSVA